MTQQETNNFDAAAGEVDDLAFDTPADAAWFETDPAVSPVLKNFLRAGGDEIEASHCCCSRCPVASFIATSKGVFCFCKQISRISAYYLAKNGLENRELSAQAFNPTDCDEKRLFERQLENKLEEKK